MPRMTAQQLFWTGAGVLVLGVVCSLGYQSMIYDYSMFGVGWFYRFFVVGSGVLVALGSALLVGGLVVGALQRGPAPQRPSYPPQGGYAPQAYAGQQPYAGPTQPYAGQPPYAGPAPQQPSAQPAAPQQPVPEGYGPQGGYTPPQGPGDAPR